MNRYELLRYERGLARADVVDGSGVKLGTLTALERGEIVRPGAPIAKALADFYGISVAELLGLGAKDAA